MRNDRIFENEKVDISDRHFLEIAINVAKSYQNITLDQFANHIEPEHDGSVCKSWSVSKLNKILDGQMELTFRRRRLILRTLKRMLPREMFEQAKDELLGLKDVVVNQLTMSLIALLSLGAFISYLII